VDRDVGVTHRNSAAAAKIRIDRRARVTRVTRTS
jgi:hypothetical protein